MAPSPSPTVPRLRLRLPAYLGLWRNWPESTRSIETTVLGECSTPPAAASSLSFQIPRERDREIPSPRNTNPPALGAIQRWPPRRCSLPCRWPRPRWAKEEASLKAKAKAEKESAVLKTKAETEAEEAIVKAEAKKEEAIIKAQAEAEKEEGIIEANCCCGSNEEDAPYDKLWHDSDTEEDPDIIMAKTVERWDLFIKEQEARFPHLQYGDSCPREYTVDDQEGSADDQEGSDHDEQYYYYHRLLDEGLLV
ncbi:hypothetical protein ZWY2020_018478 [Hordeum vulgare]|nr:hypothetical protein ZWY2020_018478 [Hordeum vulgare]